MRLGYQAGCFAAEYIRNLMRQGRNTPVRRFVPCSEREDTMSNQDDEDAQNRHEVRIMWGFTAGVVLLILGMMGANILFHHPADTSTEISSQSRTAPQN